MLDIPEPRHIPALMVAVTMTFGGVWPLLDPRGSMLEFGLPPRIANTPAAAPVFKSGNARTTVTGLLTFFFYVRNQLDVVDTIMAITGAYCGLVDGYVVWGGGKPAAGSFPTRELRLPLGLWLLGVNRWPLNQSIQLSPGFT
ncbi:hypothetical protein F5B21DRAFT_503187 [Xylaria acuta]|nr:hypothetical protein F5B21DRAFT_503187 [Xylaria acuta]